MARLTNAKMTNSDGYKNILSLKEFSKYVKERESDNIELISYSA